MSTPQEAFNELGRLQVDLDEAMTRLVSARNLKHKGHEVTFARHVREISELLTMTALQVELFARIERQAGRRVVTDSPDQNPDDVPWHPAEEMRVV